MKIPTIPASPNTASFYLRHRCHDIAYPDQLPTASIIICFFREEHAALIRTIHSILDRTPTHLLEEIILVDDTDEGKGLGRLSGEGLGRVSGNGLGRVWGKGLLRL